MTNPRSTEISGYDRSWMIFRNGLDKFTTARCRDRLHRAWHADTPLFWTFYHLIEHFRYGGSRDDERTF